MTTPEALAPLPCSVVLPIGEYGLPPDNHFCASCRAEGALRWAEQNAKQYRTARLPGLSLVCSAMACGYYTQDYRQLTREQALAAIRERIQ